MNCLTKKLETHRRGYRKTIATGLVLLGLVAAPALAGDRPPFQARAGIAIAQQAAHAWAGDAILVYLENDEPVGETGAAERWGYLYFSPSQEKARVYSVREGKILVAENLEMLFDAPPVATNWIDSNAALSVAEGVGGRMYCQQHQGKLSTMLLMRGAFHSGDPNQTTWTLIYTSPHAPSLFVVVDAVEGKVRRTWRG
jgi:hypothetical protein